MKYKMKSSYTMAERSKSESMKPAQSQSGMEVGQVTSQDGKPMKGFMFRIEPMINKNQAAGEKECCR